MQTTSVRVVIFEGVHPRCAGEHDDDRERHSVAEPRLPIVLLRALIPRLTEELNTREANPARGTSDP